MNMHNGQRGPATSSRISISTVSDGSGSRLCFKRSPSPTAENDGESRTPTSDAPWSKFGAGEYATAASGTKLFSVSELSRASKSWRLQWGSAALYQYA